MLARYAAVAAVLTVAGLAALVPPGGRSEAAAPPVHRLRVAGVGVGMFPAFAAGIERYAVTTTPDTDGTVRVTASTSDPAGTVLVNGRPAADDTTRVTGLAAGDEISVIVSDTAGTAVHSLVYLPAQFPTLEPVTRRTGTAPGYVALTLTGWNQIPTPAFEAIVDDWGVPVYVRGSANASVDLKRAANGHYTVSRPTTTAGRTGRSLVELDGHFQPVAEYETVGLPDTDGHDSILRPDGSRVLLGYQPDPGTGLIDATIQEVDPQGRVVHTWDSGSVPGEDLPAESVMGAWNEDYAHVNSVWETADGNLLASFRHLSVVLKIDWRTDDGDGRGGLIWKLGGRDSDFTFPDDPHGGPCAQHTASELPNGNILIFDNGSSSFFNNLCVDPADRWGPPVERRFTRVTEYALGESAGTATLVRDLAPADRFAFFGSSASRLPNGNTLLGWSATKGALLATEVDPSGRILWELRSVPPDPAQPNDFYSTYRAAKLDVPDVDTPDVQITSPVPGATYAFGAVARAQFGCTDRGGSSLRSCVGTTPYGARLDTTTPGPHSFTVVATDGSQHSTTLTRSYTVSTATQLADAWIRRVGADTWVGNDVHGSAQHQTVRARLPRAGATATARLRVQNDGSVPDSLTVRGTGPSRAFAVTYLSGGTRVTRRVVDGRYRTPVLAPQEWVVLRVRVTRTAPARPGAARTFQVRTAPAADPARWDAVALGVTAP